MPFSSFRKAKNSCVNRRSSSPLSSSEYDSFESEHTPHGWHFTHAIKQENLGKRGSTDSSTTSSSRSDTTVRKSNYRIVFLGACKTGKTSIIRQFLYDTFDTKHKETMDDMYRGEFEFHSQTVSFDIQDVSGNYVYEFPAMRNVSLSSADAFIIVFSLDDCESWEEVSQLRDMIHNVKDSEVPIVVVGNKSDLPHDQNLPCDSLEAIVTFDWENGYVESSAKEKHNIDKIFKELLQQAKTKFDFFPTVQEAPSSTSIHNAHLNHIRGATQDDHFKRRQSLPLVPNGKKGVGTINDIGITHKIVHSTEEVRRSSLAAIRRESCKIS